MRNTPAGQEGSEKHNSVLKLATLRHAIVAQLRSPPQGLEEIVCRHFSMVRKRVLVQARRWMLEERNKGSALFHRFEKIYLELLNALSDESICCKIGCLPPFSNDLARLKELDPIFFVESSETVNETKIPPARSGDSVEPNRKEKASSGLAHSHNPWACSVRQTEMPMNSNENVEVEDSDDDFYI